MQQVTRGVGVLLAAVLACTSGVASGAPKRVEKRTPLAEGRQPTAIQRYLQRADAAIHAADQADDAALREPIDTLATLAADPFFDELTAPSQRRLLASMALATWRSGDPEGARALLVRATRIDGNDPDDWYRLASLEHLLGDRARASRYLTAFVRRWPELANNLDHGLLVDLIFRGETGNSVRTPLLEALLDAGWDNRGNGVDEAWRELALDQLAAGRRDAASATVARIGDPIVVIGVRSDQRFDVLADAVAALPSPRDAAGRRVDALRTLIDAEPMRVDLASTYGTALLVAGRHEEALKASDAMLAALDADPAGTGFEPLDHRPWVLNNRAIALRRLGRIDEAVDAIERASRIDESSGGNVSQVLNLAALYCHLGKPRQAQQAVERLGRDISAYGRMVLAGVQHCAALQRGDTAGARRAMDYLRSHRRDGEPVLLEATLRAGRLEEAARIVIEQLEGPGTRHEALAFVQQFRRAPELPGNRDLRAHYLALLARPDVRAAVERVGRFGEHDVFDQTGIE